MAWVGLPATCALAIISATPFATLAAQTGVTRASLLQAESAEFDDNRRVELLSQAAAPALGPVDDAWRGAVQRLALVLHNLERENEAGLWLKWAIRLDPAFQPDPARWTPAMMTAYETARAYVEGSRSDNDSLVTARWEWPAAGESVGGQFGFLRFEGADGGLNIGGVILQAGATSPHRVGSYAMQSDRSEEFGFTREILPGITMVVDFQLPVAAAVAPEELARRLDPATAPMDSVWQRNIQGVVQALVIEGRAELARTWLRWAMRRQPTLAPTADAPFALARWYDEARAHVQSTGGSADDRVQTTWRWSPDVFSSPSGSVSFSGTPGALRVNDQLVQPGGMVQLPPGTYTMQSDAYEDVAVEQEVLPGVSTVVSFELPPLPEPSVFDSAMWPWGAQDMIRVRFNQGRQIDSDLNTDEARQAVRDFIAESGLVLEREGSMSFSCSNCLDMNWITADSAKTEYVRFFLTGRGGRVYVLANSRAAEERWANRINRALAARFVQLNVEMQEPFSRAQSFVDFYFRMPGWSGEVFEMPEDFDIVDSAVVAIMTAGPWTSQPTPSMPGLRGQVGVHGDTGDSVAIYVAVRRVSSRGRPQGRAQVGIAAQRPALRDSMLQLVQNRLTNRHQRGRVREEDRPVTSREVARSLGYVRDLTTRLEDAYAVLSPFVEGRGGQEQQRDGSRYLWRLPAGDSGEMISVILEREQRRVWFGVYSPDVPSQKQMFLEVSEALGVPMN